MEKLLNMAGP